MKGVKSKETSRQVVQYLALSSDGKHTVRFQNGCWAPLSQNLDRMPTTTLERILQRHPNINLREEIEEELIKRLTLIP